MLNIMDYRKLIKFGHNAYVLTMPTTWLKRNNMTKGDVLFVEEVSNQLIISTEKENTQEEQIETLTIQETDTGSMIARKLISAYENNATTIIIQGKELYTKAKEIAERIKLFTALEIIEHTKNRIICKTYIDTTNLNIHSFIRRIDNGVKSIMKDLIEQLNKQQNLKQFREDIVEREKNIDKITRLLRRVIKERLYTQGHKKENPLMLLRYWQTIIYIEEIGDFLEEMSLSPFEYYLKKEREQSEIYLKQAITLFEKAMHIFYQENTTKAHLLADEIKQIQQRIEQELRKEQHSILIHKISQSIYLIHEINKVNY
ncbi:hypothetical protein K9M74_04615 [Candidatus Woesearchaeota archaeon]|nr:hypothetical protein [Candidatus Woesearchaeota archaeon]